MSKVPKVRNESNVGGNEVKMKRNLTTPSLPSLSASLEKLSSPFSLIKRDTSSSRNLSTRKKEATSQTKIRKEEAFERSTFRILIPNRAKDCRFPKNDEILQFLSNLETRQFVIQGKTSIYSIYILISRNSFFFWNEGEILSFFLVVEKSRTEEDAVYEEYQRLLEDSKKVEDGQRKSDAEPPLPKTDFYNSFLECLLAMDLLEKQTATSERMVLSISLKTLGMAYRQQIISMQSEHQFEVHEKQDDQFDLSLSPASSRQYYLTKNGQIFLFLLKIPIGKSSGLGCEFDLKRL